MEDIRRATLTDSALRDVIRHCQSTWPPINDFSSDVRLYAHSKDHLTYDDGVLMFDTAHQGIVKSCAKAC